MPIQNINVDYTGQIGILPRTVKIICNDSYSAITASGYLSDAQVQGFSFYPSDVFLITFLNNEFGIFTPNFSGSSITLAPWVSEGNVTLPVVSGRFASFSGTTGLIADKRKNFSSESIDYCI